MEHTHHSRASLDTWFRFVERRPLSDRFVLTIFAFAVIGAVAYGLVSLSNYFATDVAVTGGTVVEGIVGTPRFVNPVLATTRVDHDLTTLLYRGLVKIDDTGTLIPDIAETITVSDDGRTYHITLRTDVTFHDGTPLTARDVSYTIGLIQNPDLKSPLSSNWFDVLVEELGDHELNLVIDEAYPPFLENLTVGIMPRALWDELPIEQLPFSQHNTEPVGSGPYRVSDIIRNRAGLIEAYELTAFPDHVPPPNIERLTLRFYNDEVAVREALAAGDIMSTPSLELGQLALIDQERFTIYSSPLPRTFALFLNQNKSSALRDQAARSALSYAIDRQLLVDTVLAGHGSPLIGPLPPTFVTSTDAASTTAYSLELARDTLRDGGWVQNSDGQWEKSIGGDTVLLRATITTVDTPLFEQTATAIADRWRELGVDVGTAQYAQGDLVQAIVRPRDFEVLLFGADVGRPVDLYSFWHSSQKDDPGLNVAQYTNIAVDELLETARTATDPTDVATALQDVATILTDEAPAIFLFVPHFTYVADKTLVLTPFTRLGRPSDRFMNVNDWYAERARLWPIFRE